MKHNLLETENITLEDINNEIVGSIIFAIHKDSPEERAQIIEHTKSYANNYGISEDEFNKLLNNATKLMEGEKE